MTEIYQPAEDSYMLSKVLKKLEINKEMKILDMGAGSGIQSETLIQLGANPKNLTLVDINKKAVDYLKEKFPKSKIINSDLFENVRGKYGIIIFNPPYLPEDFREPQNSKIATTGGKKGSEVINRFLEQSKKHLNSEGKIILLTSSLTKEINWKGWKKKILGKKRLFFEEIYIWSVIKD